MPNKMALWWVGVTREPAAAEGGGDVREAGRTGKGCRSFGQNEAEAWVCGGIGNLIQ